MFWWLWLACAVSPPAVPVDTVDPGDDTSSSPVDTAAGRACPRGMAPLSGSVCIDRWEASLQVQQGDEWVAYSPYLVPDGRPIRARAASGEVPAGYLSGHHADEACRNAGKRLCTSDEWLHACQGDAQSAYPYGDTYKTDACNDDYPGGHPVVDLFGTNQGVWDSAHMNDPRINQQPNTVAPSAQFDQCVTPTGVYDLHGNLHEWVGDADGVFRGGFYADASINGAGCRYRTGAHSRSYHDYSTGFRCCADVE